MLKVPKEHRVAIGEILKQKRELKNLSLRDLGEKLLIDAANLSRIERGQSSISYDKLTQAAIILDAPELFMIMGLPMPEYFRHKQLSESMSTSIDFTEVLINFEDPFKNTIN